MSVTYARGWRKNLALTAWLMLPFVVVGGLVVGIFLAYRQGPVMDARPVGQGAGDTGGANALGQWLAGRNPDEVQRVRRDLREGRLIDPVAWPHGVNLRITPGEAPDETCSVWLWGGRGSPPPSAAVVAGTDSSVFTLSHDQLAGILRDGRPGAGIYVSLTKTVLVAGATLTDAGGNTLERVELPLVRAEEVIEGLPVEIRVRLNPD